MQPQVWRPLGVEWRYPTPAIVLLSAIQFYALHHQYGFRSAASAFVAVVALDCVRIRRTRTTAPAPAKLDVGGMSLPKRLQHERRNY
ncbi:hypothetical protein [Streptomyces sp. NPDC054794]